MAIHFKISNFNGVLAHLRIKLVKFPEGIFDNVNRWHSIFSRENSFRRADENRIRSIYPEGKKKTAKDFSTSALIIGSPITLYRGWWFARWEPKRRKKDIEKEKKKNCLSVVLFFVALLVNLICPRTVLFVARARWPSKLFISLVVLPSLAATEQSYIFLSFWLSFVSHRVERLSKTVDNSWRHQAEIALEYRAFVHFNPSVYSC